MQHFDAAEKGVALSKFGLYNNLATNNLNQDSFVRLMGNRFYFEAPYAPVKSNVSYTDELNYDSTSTYKSKFKFVGSDITRTTTETKGELIELLKGRRDNALKALNTAY